ncbi:MAG: NAD(P)/FAD-dependent oxidoreductase [Alphaproteobacteria bacterium]
MSQHLTTDVAIIGGGTAGCAAALHLAKQGQSVTLFERRTVGSQASGVNFGGVRQHGRDVRELPLSRRAREIWAQLPVLVGNDCEFMPTGHLKLARDEAQMADLEQFARTAGDFSLEVELLGQNALRQRFPWLGQAVIGASLCPSDGQANPRLVAPCFARAARAAGAIIYEHEGVVGATKNGDGFHLETERGTKFQAGTLLNVAGAWAGRVAAWFGESVPVDVLSPNMQVSEPLPYRLDVNIGVAGGDVYARQIPRGNLIFGGGRGWSDREAISARPVSESTRDAMARLIEILPWTISAQVIRTWSGIEGFMPDGIPVIGPSATTPGLIHAFGFSGHGFQLGPVIGEILAELAVDGRSSISVDAFAIRRFNGVGEAA